MTIRIHDSRDKPYGPLSIYYEKNIKINDTEWSSVANFIYSNIIQVPIVNQTIKNERSYKTKQLFYRLYNMEKEKIIHESIQEALVQKFHQYPHLNDILLETGEMPIRYSGNNEYIGKIYEKMEFFI